MATDFMKLGISVDTREVKKAEKEVSSLATTTEKTARRSVKATDQMKGGWSSMRSAIGLVGTAMAALGVRELIQVNRQFAVMRSSLVTVTGSADKANAAFQQISSFAAQTPFSIQEVTNSFIKLKSLGLDPSEAAMRSYGNTAAAMGKSMNQMIEAVADASTGEFERLKEFGIKAKSQGDQVSLTFQGVTKTIGKNSEEIQQYLMDIGNVQFAGAMERQAASLDGALSNLGDSWDSFLDRLMGPNLESATGAVISAMAEILRAAGDAAELLDGLFADGDRFEASNAAHAAKVLEDSIKSLEGQISQTEAAMRQQLEALETLEIQAQNNSQMEELLAGSIASTKQQYSDSEAKLAELKAQLAAYLAQQGAAPATIAATTGAIQAQIGALQEQSAAFAGVMAQLADHNRKLTMTAEQYQFATYAAKGMTAAEIKEAMALWNTNNALKENKKATEAAAKAAAKAAKSTAKAAAKAAKSTAKASEKAAKSTAEASAKAAKQVEEDAAKMTEAVNGFIDDFVDAAFDGFESVGGMFEDLLVNMVKQAAANQIRLALDMDVTGGGLSLFGGGGSTGILDIASGLNTGYGLLTGTSALSTALGYGTSVAGLTAGGMGMSQASMLAAQTAEFGLAGTSATMSAAGYSAYTALANAVPYIAAAVALYSIFGDDDPPDITGAGDVDLTLNKLNTALMGADVTEDNAAIGTAMAEAVLGLNNAIEQITGFDPTGRFRMWYRPDQGAPFQISPGGEGTPAETFKTYEEWLARTNELLLEGVGLTTEEYQQIIDLKTMQTAFTEGLKPLQQRLQEAGLELPATQEAFNQLLTELDLTTEAGRNTFATFYSLRTEISALYKEMEQNKEMEQTLYKEMEQNGLGAMWANVAKEFETAVSSSFKVLSDAVETQKTAVEEAYEASADSIANQIETKLGSVEVVRELSDALAAAIGDAAISGGMDRFAATRYLQGVIATARSGGGLPTAEGISGALTALTGVTGGQFASRLEYQRYQATTTSLLTDLKSLADDEITTEELSLEELEKQSETLTATYEAEIERLDGILENAQEQLDTLNGIDNTLVGVEAALLAFNNSIQALASSQTAFGGAAASEASSAAVAMTGRATREEEIAYLAGADLQAQATVDAIAEYTAKYNIGAGEAAGIFSEALGETVTASELRTAGLAFANGGFHAGGLRMVGERGPELEWTGQSNIMSNASLRDMLDSTDVVNEIRELRQENRAALYSVAKNTNSIRKLNDQWNNDGLPPERTQ